MKYILITLSLAGLALATPTSPLAPLSKRGEVIDDSYIVVLKKDVNPQQMALHLAGLEEWHSADVRLPSSLFNSPFLPFFQHLISRLPSGTAERGKSLWSKGVGYLSFSLLLLSPRILLQWINDADY
jgi:hypothetical protein